MSVVDRIIRGIRDSIPGGGTGRNSGYVLGRTDKGDGPVHLIAIEELLRNAGGNSKTIQAFLDSITSVRGSLLERGSTGWVGFPPSAANKILKDGGSGADPSWVTLSALMDTVFGSAQGDVLYRDASGWTALAPGTAPAVLTTGGASANPSWASVAASATLASHSFRPDGVSSNGQLTASRGNIITPTHNMSVLTAYACLRTVVNGTYKIGIAPYDTVNEKITGAPTYSNVYTATTVVDPDSIAFTFATPVTLTAYTTYAVFIVRTDATASTTMTMYSLATPSVSISPGIYAPASNTKIRLASLAPTTSDVWTRTETGVNDVGITYALT